LKPSANEGMEMDKTKFDGQPNLWNPEESGIDPDALWRFIDEQINTVFS
jgi:hypothetical protein